MRNFFFGLVAGSLFLSVLYFMFGCSLIGAIFFLGFGVICFVLGWFFGFVDKSFMIQGEFGSKSVGVKGNFEIFKTPCYGPGSPGSGTLGFGGDFVGR